MENQKKRKNFFSHALTANKKIFKSHTLKSGIKGFFCTCNYREKECTQEAYNILGYYSEKIEKIENQSLKDSSLLSDCKIAEKNEQVMVNTYKENFHGIKDVLDVLNMEINALKNEELHKSLFKSFQVIDTGIKNVIFIQSNFFDPLELFTVLIKDFQLSNKQKTRYLLRMLPIVMTCKPYLDELKTKADILFNKFFVHEPKSFCIVFNRHSNNNLNRNQVIELLAEIIISKNPGNKANLKNPEIAVVIEVVKANCLVSIAPNYFLLKKYNLQEMCNNE